MFEDSLIESRVAHLAPAKRWTAITSIMPSVFRSCLTGDHPVAAPRSAYATGRRPTRPCAIHPETRQDRAQTDIHGDVERLPLSPIDPSDDNAPNAVSNRQPCLQRGPSLNLSNQHRS